MVAARHYMFTRFRQTARRLQVSFVETRRINGQVRHSHVASLGAIRVSPSAADCIAFWTKLHQRLATLRFAVVLMTPDDVGGTAGQDQSVRTRQNVLFELGDEHERCCLDFHEEWRTVHP